jgi:two-component system capsular synthesis sensor histidine kinase RcsC
VFEPFQRGAAAPRASGGAGLGLALARRLATGMRGRLWIADAPGGGARLALALPLVSVRDVDAEPEAPARTAPARAASSHAMSAR